MRDRALDHRFGVSHDSRWIRDCVIGDGADIARAGEQRAAPGYGPVSSSRRRTRYCPTFELLAPRRHVGRAREALTRRGYRRDPRWSCGCHAPPAPATRRGRQAEPVDQNVTVHTTPSALSILLAFSAEINILGVPHRTPAVA